MVREREPDHGLVPSEPADQAQVPPVGLKDVGLVIKAWLGGVSGADPPPVAQANDLLRMSRPGAPHAFPAATSGEWPQAVIPTCARAPRE